MDSTLATRLGSDEFAWWVEWELNGYPDSQPTPDYRRLRGACFAEFMSPELHAENWQVPWSLIPEEHRRTLHPKAFREGVAKAASFVAEGCYIDLQSLRFEVQGGIFPGLTCVRLWLQIPASEFEQLVSAVKNRILDFVLKIEAENPDAGEAPLNSQPVPTERVRPLVNNFFGPVGNLAQNSQGFSQSANSGFNLKTSLGS